MKLKQIHNLLQESYYKSQTSADINTGNWYHRSKNKYDKYDMVAKKAQRGQNIAGMYLTRNPNLEAERYGNYLYTYKVDVNKTFYYGAQNGENEVNSGMVDKFKEFMLDYYAKTVYDPADIDTEEIPVFIKMASTRGRFPSMHNDAQEGEMLREILLAGGYDSYMDGSDLVLLEPEKTSKLISVDVE
jgi:hypothetical protein